MKQLSKVMEDLEWVSYQKKLEILRNNFNLISRQGFDPVYQIVENYLNFPEVQISPCEYNFNSGPYLKEPFEILWALDTEYPDPLPPPRGTSGYKRRSTFGYSPLLHRSWNISSPRIDYELFLSCSSEGFFLAKTSYGAVLKVYTLGDPLRRQIVESGRPPYKTKGSAGYYLPSLGFFACKKLMESCSEEEKRMHVFLKGRSPGNVCFNQLHWTHRHLREGYKNLFGRALFSLLKDFKLSEEA